MQKMLLYTSAKPFLKWAGGKSQLIDEIDKRLPKQDIQSQRITRYVEPFVGGGAVFFHIAQHYGQYIKEYCLFDINEDLIACYQMVKNDCEKLISQLRKLETQFLAKDQTERKLFYYEIREQFNKHRNPAKLIFLNKTCFNGLYRVNRKGLFNVPFGDYKNPTICNEPNLRAASDFLRHAQIIHGDFEKSSRFVDKQTFVYFDPPYLPLNNTANFTSYAKGGFPKKEQVRLAEFCQVIDDRDALFLLSNSDPHNEDPENHFFERHYTQFSIETVKASRAINCKASGRGQINELIIINYG